MSEMLTTYAQRIALAELYSSGICADDFEQLADCIKTDWLMQSGCDYDRSCIENKECKEQGIQTTYSCNILITEPARSCNIIIIDVN